MEEYIASIFKKGIKKFEKKKENNKEKASLSRNHRKRKLQF